MTEALDGEAQVSVPEWPPTQTSVEPGEVLVVLERSRIDLIRRRRPGYVMDGAHPPLRLRPAPTKQGVVMPMRSIATRVASPLIASIFIRGGLDAATDPEGKVKKAEKITGPIAQRISVLPDDTEMLVRVNGVTQVVAGMTLSLGILRRVSAAVLAGTLIPTTLAGHRFWDELDEDARNMQITQFAKNLGLFGGLLLIATEGATRRSSLFKKVSKGRLRIRRGQ